MRRTKIVATIGPASRDPEVLARMVEAGLDVARLNFSHGTIEEHAETAQLVRDASDRAGRAVALLQDLPGPKLRIGALAGGTVELHPGGKLEIVCGEEIEGTAERISITWPGLAEATQAGDVLFLADGRVRLAVDAVDHAAATIRTTIEIGGTIASKQGLNVPGETASLPAVPERDLELLRAGADIGIDIVAISFVRKASDIEQVREHTRAPLVAKFEKPQAVANAEEIVHVSDCVMVARGDLGIELPLEEVPIVQKRLLALAGRYARPSITATQMLDSMVTSPRPTRAEVTDVANAILDGTDAVMLSQETAVGAYPVEAIRVMDRVARQTEKTAPYDRWREERVARDGRDPGYTIAYTAVASAEQLGLAAIVVPTLSGRSARIVSAHRPKVPIYVLSPGRETVRRCSLIWGVQAAGIPRREITEELIAEAAKRVVELGWVERGQRVGITAGLPSGRPGTTSLLQIQTVPGEWLPWLAPRDEGGGPAPSRARRGT